MTAVLQQHEDNAVKVAEVASELSKPPNLRSASSNGSAPQESSSKTNGIAAALFQRKGKDKKKSGSNSKAKKDHRMAQDVKDVKQSEEAALRDPSTVYAVTEPGTTEDPVLDLADQLLDQLDTKEEEEETEHTPASTQARPATAGEGPEISKVPSAHSTTTTSSSASAESNVSDSTAKSSSTHRLSNLFSKKNRQAAKLERREREMQAQRDAAQKEADSARRLEGDPVEQERQSMMSICRSLNVEMVEMNPDGHCLYAAVAHQLNLQPARYMRPDARESYQSVRNAVAKYMRANPDDFIYFLPSEDGVMSSEKFDKYCDNIENTAEWGGQPEILAVSNSYQVPVIIYQAGSPPLKLGEHWVKKLPLRLSYHRRMYGLGEHYNSLRRRPEQIAMPVPIG